MATGLQTRHGNILQEAFKNGLQSFVNTTTNTLAATSTAGTPAAGTFYSTISNRASMVDISQDLKASFGIERVQVQSVVQLQNEFGPNGEPVFSVVNDDRGLVRFVGGGWGSYSNNSGQYQFTPNNNDFLEITFYGTGVNMLATTIGTTRDVRASTDGASEGSNIYVSGSAILTGRNYSGNSVISAVSGLTLGVHTVRLRNVGTGFDIFGFEILNTASTTSLNVNPGIAYVDGLKIVSSAAQSISYNSTFETGTLGTRGGHVVTYLKQDGTVGKAVTPVNAASAFLTSADHTNEEMYRQYYPREFGAGRSDDWSLISSTAAALAFTLDDGTTTLTSSSGAIVTSGSASGAVFGANGAAMRLTFIGTGLDLMRYEDSTLTGAVINILVDGASVGALDTTFIAGRTRNLKICSGLPYGTHTVNFAFVSGSSGLFVGFKVYQPKKPSVPTGAIELADYNVLATYVSGSNGAYVASTGVLYKSEMREVSYTGTWTSSIGTGFSTDFWSNTTTTVGSTWSYTFFGTGFEAFIGSNTGNSFGVSLDGSTYTGSATIISPGASFSAGTITTSTIWNGAFQVTGLTLGLHTIKFTFNSGTNMATFGFSVITPIYSAKSNVNADFQNTLPVGSNSLSDNRQVSVIKATDKPRKNWVQSVGITSQPSTTSSSLVPCPDMSVVLNTSGGRVLINYSIVLFENTAGYFGVLQIYIDGLPVGINKIFEGQNSGNAYTTVSDSWIAQLSPGAHKIDVYWAAGNGTAVSWLNARTMNAAEF